MTPIIAFPIPTDAATAAWAGPVFALMALTTAALVIWQAVRYFRGDRDDGGGDENERDQ